MRTGVLSDESILTHCAHHRPIPMHLVSKVLSDNSDAFTPYSSKKLKYQISASRPNTFDTLATQLNRHSEAGNVRDSLHAALTTTLLNNGFVADTEHPTLFHSPLMQEQIAREAEEHEAEAPSPAEAEAPSPERVESSPERVEPFTRLNSAAVIRAHERMRTPDQQRQTGTPQHATRLAGARNTPAPIPIQGELSQSVSNNTRNHGSRRP